MASFAFCRERGVSALYPARYIVLLYISYQAITKNDLGLHFTVKVRSQCPKYRIIPPTGWRGLFLSCASAERQRHFWNWCLGPTFGHESSIAIRLATDLWLIADHLHHTHMVIPKDSFVRRSCLMSGSCVVELV